VWSCLGNADNRHSGISRSRFSWKIRNIYRFLAIAFITHRIKSISNNVTTASCFSISLCIFLFISLPVWQVPKQRIWQISKSKFWAVSIYLNRLLYEEYFEFSRLYQTGSPEKIEKLKCILHYFRRVTDKSILIFSLRDDTFTL